MPRDSFVDDDELPHSPVFDLIGDLRHRHDHES
jgi:hypothetical protein